MTSSTSTPRPARTAASPPAAEGSAAPRAARPARDEGQWALGSTTPLNPNEEFKAADGGLNVREAAARLKIGKTSLYAALQAAREADS